MGFPSGSLGTSHSRASGPPKTMKAGGTGFLSCASDTRGRVSYTFSETEIS